MDKIKKEKRERFLTNLINEAIINVLAEKASAVPPATTPPAPNMNPTDADVRTPPPPQPATPDEVPAPQEKPFDVDEMVNRLNVLRGSKSFKDPEVYGRLTTFFKGLPEDQKATLDSLLSELGKIVIDASEQQAGLEQPMNQPAGRQPPGPGNPGGISQPPPNAGAAPVSPA